LGEGSPFGFRVCCVSHGNNPILCCEVRDSLLIDNHLKQDIMYRGKDWDIDLKGTPVRAYVVYWNCEHRIIKECVIHAETVWPLTLPEAISGFRPEFAKGANVNFQFVDGTFSITNIMKF
jgi:hypothetical protein